MADNMKLTVTAKRRILKYAEGANPEIDEPIGVEEKEVILHGNEAVQALEQMNISKESALQIARNNKGAGS